jgi:Gram-negative bacterial TonB protein C-terminal
MLAVQPLVRAQMGLIMQKVQRTRRTKSFAASAFVHIALLASLAFCTNRQPPTKAMKPESLHMVTAVFLPVSALKQIPTRPVSTGALSQSVVRSSVADEDLAVASPMTVVKPTATSVVDTQKPELIQFDPRSGNTTLLSSTSNGQMVFGDAVRESAVHASETRLRGEASGFGEVKRSAGTGAALSAVQVAVEFNQTLASKVLEIISAPTPVYTEDALRKKIHGQVLLEADFPPEGPARFIRFVQRLDEGLDQAAIRATEQIVFKPAQERGRPVAVTALVRVDFNLIVR